MKRHLLFAAIVVAGFAASRRPHAQDKRGFVWDDRPSIVFGEDINIDLTGRVQLDWRWFDPEVDEDAFDLRTLRIGLKGELTRHFDWEIEREIDETRLEEDDRASGASASGRTCYLNWTTFDAFSIKGGRFKMPFGLEQNTGVSDLDFAYRALGSTKIAPGRDTRRDGVRRALGGALIYEAGVFDDDGDNGELEARPSSSRKAQDLEDVGPSVAVRVVGELFRGLPVHDRLKGAEFGIAYTTLERARRPEQPARRRGVGLQLLRARLRQRPPPAPRPAVRLVARARSGSGRSGCSRAKQRHRPEQSQRGPVGFHRHGVVHAARRGSSPARTRTATSRRTIRCSAAASARSRSASRYDQLTFESASKDGPDFTNPRAEHLTPNTDSTLTFGVNWMPIRWVKVVANAHPRRPSRT